MVAAARKLDPELREVSNFANDNGGIVREYSGTLTGTTKFLENSGQLRYNKREVLIESIDQILDDLIADQDKVRAKSRLEQFYLTTQARPEAAFSSAAKPDRSASTFTPSRLYRGKVADGDPVAFLKDVWRKPLEDGDLTQADVRASDSKLIRAIINKLGGDTSAVLQPARRGGRKPKPLPTPEEAVQAMADIRKRGAERAAASYARRKS